MKTTLSLLALLIGLNGAFAQFKTKAYLGLSVSDFSKEEDGTAKGKAGLQLGGSIVLGKRFYFEPGIAYCVKSTEFTYEGGNGSINEEAIIHGLRVPVGIGFRLIGDDEAPINVRVFGGGSGFFVLATGGDVEKDDLESPSWGTYAGVGVDFWMIFIDASYEWSLTNVQKEIDQIDVGKHRTVFVSAGVRFPFK